MADSQFLNPDHVGTAHRHGTDDPAWGTAGPPPKSVVIPARQDPPGEPTEWFAITSPKILLVDDQKSIRVMSRRALEEAGHADVTEAKHGEEALAMMRETAFDLVISDLNMDPVDGMELLRAIRADAALAATPFILMTGQLDDDGVRQAEEAGANNTVLKPFDAPTVREKIDQVLKGSA